MDPSIIEITELRKSINQHLSLEDRISLSLASQQINREDLIDILRQHKQLKKDNDTLKNRINSNNQCAGCLSELRTDVYVTPCAICQYQYCTNCKKHCFGFRFDKGSDILSERCDNIVCISCDSKTNETCGHYICSGKHDGCMKCEIMKNWEFGLGCYDNNYEF